MAATLRLLIDAAGAETGASRFEGAAGRVTRAAKTAGGAVAGGSGSLDKSFRDADLALTRLEGNVKTIGTTMGTHTTATTKATAAQNAFGRALDVGGNFAKGFLTALAIGPIVAIGSAMANAALQALDFGDAMENSADKARRLADEARGVHDSLKRMALMSETQARFSGIPGLFENNPLASAENRLSDARKLMLNLADTFDPHNSDSYFTNDAQKRALRAFGVSDKDSLTGVSQAQTAMAQVIRQQQAVVADLRAQEEARRAAERAASRSPAASSAVIAAGPGAGIPYGGGFGMSPQVARALYEGRMRGAGADMQFQPWWGADDAALYAGPAGVGMGRLPADPLRQFLAQNRAPGYAPPAVPGYIASFGSSGEMQGPPPSDEMLDQWRAAEEAAVNVGSTFANSMERALLAADDLGDGLRNVFASVLQAIMHEAFTKPLAQEAISVAGAFFGVPGAGAAGAAAGAGASGAYGSSYGGGGGGGSSSIQGGGGGGNVFITVHAADADSFRKSGAQIAADFKRGLRRAA